MSKTSGNFENQRFDKVILREAEGLSTNGVLCKKVMYPVMLSLSKYERMVFSRYLNYQDMWLSGR